MSSLEGDREFFGKFLDDYFAECEEHLTVIRRGLLVLESSLGQPGIDKPLLNELLRGFHTIKGLSGMVGVQEAEEVAHQLENYLRCLQDCRLTLSIEGVDVLIDAARAIEEIIGAHRTGALAPDCAALLRRLAALVRMETPKASSESRGEAIEVEKQVGIALRDGLPVWRFEYTPSASLSERGVNINTTRARLQTIGRLLSASPRVAADGTISFEFLVAGPIDESGLRDWKKDGLTWARHEKTTAGEATATTKDAGTAEGTASREPFLSPSNIVRVDLGRLDELMQMVGDLVISRARLEKNLQGLGSLLPPAHAQALQETNQAIERQLRALREGVMHVRMVPIADVFERMQFIVRDLSREYGKKVRLELSGQDTEIDKRVVERVMDPLLHLVRNAISHGLETPADREAAGKATEGRLALRAFTAGDSVIIEVEDDGRGVDATRVAQRAREQGFVGDDESIDSATLLAILCMPGFSTRRDSDRVSGRGVGMDVVKTAVAELGGTVELDTRPGFGTRFSIQLPLTLAIVEALIVSISGHLYAIPALSIREVMEVRADEIIALENNEVIRYRAGVLPVVRLAEVFHLPERKRDTWVALVLDAGSKTLGLLVDRIHQQREIVVRTLDDPLLRTPGISGATELGDGQIVLILDAAALANAVKSRVARSAGPTPGPAAMPHVYVDIPQIYSGFTPTAY